MRKPWFLSMLNGPCKEWDSWRGRKKLLQLNRRTIQEQYYQRHTISLDPMCQQLLTIKMNTASLSDWHKTMRLNVHKI